MAALGPDHRGLNPCTVFYAEQGLDILSEIISRARREGLWEVTHIQVLSYEWEHRPDHSGGQKGAQGGWVHFWELGLPDLTNPTLRLH